MFLVSLEIHDSRNMDGNSVLLLDKWNENENNHNNKLNDSFVLSSNSQTPFEMKLNELSV